MPYALALILGVAGSSAFGVGEALLGVSLSALALGAAWSGLRTSASGLAICVLLFSAGAALEQRDRASATLRAESFWGDAPRLTRELSLIGRVRRAPEPRTGGRRWLALDARPERGDGASATLRAELQIASSGERGMRELDRLRAGDTVRVWCRVRPARAPRNSRADFSRAPRERGAADLRGYVKSAWLVERLDVGPATPLRAVEHLRAAARRRASRLWGAAPLHEGMLRALLLGDRAGLDAERIEPLREAGVAHVVAISGLHVGLVYGALLALALRLRCPPAILWPATGCGLLLFGSGVGARPPVVRAALGAAAGGVGRALGREGRALNALAVVAAVWIAIAPSILHDPGFRLTTLVTAGILAGARRARALVPLPGALGRTTSISLAAYLAAAPLAAWHFGRLAPVGVLTNLVAVPLCGMALGCGYGALVAEGTLVGTLLASFAALGVDGIFAVARIAASVEAASFAVARPAAALTVAYYVALLCVATDRGGRGAGLCAALLASALHVGPLPSLARGAEAHVLDVGQAQCVVLRGAGGAPALIDAGGARPGGSDAGRRVVLPYLLGWSGRRVEVLAPTHDHADHAGGAEAILDELEVGELWLAPGWVESETLQRLAARALERGTALRLVERGTTHALGRTRLVVLSPPRDVAHLGENDRSIVVRLGTAPARLLVAGDLEREGEEMLVAGGVDLRAEALVVSHHGSVNGTTRAFLRRVAPEQAIVSCGRENPFDHPHPRVLDALERSGARVWRTDLHGRVRLNAVGAGWRVESASGIASGREDERDRYERDDEHRDQQPGYRDSSAPQLGRLVEQARVPVAHPEEDGEPQQVGRNLALRDVP
ncbi:MAG: DNA internalization-related competence protein ComEC/Rec2 [bacterium]|nr:DNA internalization-related competence protein ComEC/Rec2 [bacterium]